MKFSEKMLLIKQGATLADIKKFEEEEAAEIAESKNNSPDESNPEVKESEKDPKTSEDDKSILTALEAATKALEESKNIIQKQKDDLEAMNEKFLKLTNGQTVAENTIYTEKEVMQELFKPNKKEES